VDAGVDPAVTAAFVRSVASRAVAESLPPRAGPVHVNVRLREPLVPTGGPVPDLPGAGDGAPWTAVPHAPAPAAGVQLDLARRLAGTGRGVLVAGWGAGVDPAVALAAARATGWPLLADPLSGLRVP